MNSKNKVNSAKVAKDICSKISLACNIGSLVLIGKKHLGYSRQDDKSLNTTLNILGAVGFISGVASGTLVLSGVVQATRVIARLNAIGSMGFDSIIGTLISDVAMKDKTGSE